MTRKVLHSSLLIWVSFTSLPLTGKVLRCLSDLRSFVFLTEQDLIKFCLKKIRSYVCPAILLSFWPIIAPKGGLKFNWPIYQIIGLQSIYQILGRFIPPWEVLGLGSRPIGLRPHLPWTSKVFFNLILPWASKVLINFAFLRKILTVPWRSKVLLCLKRARSFSTCTCFHWKSIVQNTNSS